MVGLLQLIALTGCSSTMFRADEAAAPTAVPGGEDPGETPTGTDPGTTPTDPGTEPETPAPDLPSAYTWTGGFDNGDPVDLGVVEDALGQAVAAATGYSSAPVFSAYRLAMQAARPDCPGATDSGGVQFWATTCVTPDGAVFEGYGSLIEYDESNFAGTVLNANALINTASGYTYVSAASILEVHMFGVGSDRRAFDAWTSGVGGTNSWDGPGVGGTWMEDALQPAITLDFNSYDDGARDGRVSGVVAVDLGVFDAVAYGDTTVRNAASGAACWEEPEGSVSLRDANANWYEVRFDGGVEVDDLDSCDGCGEVWWRGESLGEVCVDFSSWLGWGASPW